MPNRIVTERVAKVRMSKTKQDKMIVGNLEVCDLPDFGIKDLEVRIDTGASTSSLHVDNLVKFKKGGKPWLKFDIHPDVYNIDKVTTCKIALHSVRRVKSSNAQSELRYIIKTLIKLGAESWPIEISLTNRSDMSYLMLLGREGMGSHILVDPSQAFLLKV